MGMCQKTRSLRKNKQVFRLKQTVWAFTKLVRPLRSALIFGGGQMVYKDMLYLVLYKNA